jgi:hypothetical protein
MTVIIGGDGYKRRNRDNVPDGGLDSVGINDYRNNYISFSGTDAVATMIVPKIDYNDEGKKILLSENEPINLGELQTISYSMHRENSPVRTLGHVNPRGFIKGGRTIAGSLIFTVFNEYAFYRIGQYREMLAREKGFFAPLADMLPPFDVVLSFTNEYGQSSKMKIYGITIVDEGQTVSVDDLITEQTYTYMARGIQPLVALRVDSEESSRSSEEVARDLQISRNIFGDSVLDEYSSFIRPVESETEEL